ncbi:MAG: hypothetical protein HY079_03255 [Elusimicrobia bacterium]|nr:hypothetical protein [Elusimicrobiota bacterium]
MTRTLVALLLAAAFLSGESAPAASAPPPENESCLGCHGTKDAGPPFVDGDAFARSPHASKACSSCHADVKDYPHPTPVAKVDCASCHAGPSKELKSGVHSALFSSKKNGRQNACVACHGNHAMRDPHKLGLSLCAQCHKGEVAKYAASVHGRARAGGDPDAAICLSCHGGGHSILKASDPAASVSALNLPKTCAKCHSDPEFAKRHGLSQTDMYKAYMASTHAKAAAAGEDAANCASCHGSHDILRPSDPASRIAERNIVKTCGRCHAVEARKFAASVHGRASARGERGAPTCVDCHGEHDIRAPGEDGSRVARSNRAKTCADCHQSERLAGRFGDRVASFRSSFHGMADKGGATNVADCASCHGWHDVLASSDPASKTNAANLTRTCGQCHEGAGKRWRSGVKVHEALAQEGGGSPLAALAAQFYGFAIPLTVLGMLVHNVLDLNRKMRGPRARRHRDDEVPLSAVERWQHAANGVSFILLAYSGFALHYPDAWWSAPFGLLGGEAVRKNAHRSAAALFLMMAAAHLAYLASRPGRSRLWAMLPAKRDLFDPLKVVSYNLGATKAKPHLLQFSYAEKFEYWALVWGSMVMTVTGGLLLFHNLALAWLPLWIIETARVVHYLEAVLACLAILIWHGYWVFFDPDVYPMNWAWLTGETYLPDPREDESEKDAGER